MQLGASLGKLTRAPDEGKLTRAPEPAETDQGSAEPGAPGPGALHASIDKLGIIILPPPQQPKKGRENGS